MEKSLFSVSTLVYHICQRLSALIFLIFSKSWLVRIRPGFLRTGSAYRASSAALFGRHLPRRGRLKSFPSGRCVAQRIQIVIAAGGSYTIKSEAGSAQPRLMRAVQTCGIRTLRRIRTGYVCCHCRRKYTDNKNPNRFRWEWVRIFQYLGYSIRSFIW